MGAIEFLKNRKTLKRILPITIEKAVYSNEGKSLDKTLEEIRKSIESGGPVFNPSGPNASSGLVPEPPKTVGSKKYLCEDGLWKDIPLIYTGTSEPSSDLGNDGDIYIKTV